jgi:hypothetical protein
MVRARLISATFRCGDVAVAASYLGQRRWELSGPDLSWSGTHEEVAIAIREALRLGDEVPYNTKVVEVVADHVSGTIKNNTFPTDLWYLDISGGGRSWASAEKGLPAAIIACLVALKLTPVREQHLPRNPVDQDQFCHSALDDAADPRGWARALEHALSDRLRSSVDAEYEVPLIVQELKLLGHDLWSFDETEDFAIWTHDYVKSPRAAVLRSGSGTLLTKNLKSRSLCRMLREFQYWRRFLKTYIAGWAARLGLP